MYVDFSNTVEKKNQILLIFPLKTPFRLFVRKKSVASIHFKVWIYYTEQKYPTVKLARSTLAILPYFYYKESVIPRSVSITLISRLLKPMPLP